MSCAEDGCERAGRRPGVHAKTCRAEVPCSRRAHEVVKPDGRQYTLKHGKVLVEAVAAGIEPLEFRRKVERKMRLDLATHDPDALFIKIAN